LGAFGSNCDREEWGVLNGTKGGFDDYLEEISTSLVIDSPMD